MKIFIAGSKTVTKLHEKAERIINGYIKNGYDILIGDCMGVDKAVQQFLYNNDYNHITVYYSGKNPRNNIGNRNCKRVLTEKEENTFEYNRQKDSEMIKETDRGFMIWDLKSKGTFANICELLLSNKEAYLYDCINKTMHTFHYFPELKEYLKIIHPKADIPQPLLEKLSEALLLSEESSDNLKLDTLSHQQIIDIIWKAPIELTIKAKWFNTLSEYQNVFFDITEALETCNKDIASIIQHYTNHSFYHCYLEINKTLTEK